MTMAAHVPFEMAQFIAQAFIAGLWQGVVLISAVAIFLRFVPQLSAAVRFAVWGFAFALAATLPLLHLPALAAARPHASSAVVHLGAEWGWGIAALWAALMAFRGARLLTQAMRLHRTWRRATPVAADAGIAAFLQSGVRTAELCTSDEVDSPSVIGFFSPRLLIPEWLFAKLTPVELQQIVLHECEHLRRNDDWINLLQKVGLVLFPLNPALLWVDRRLSLERELACDAGVVASTAAPFDYAHCLTRLAEHRLHRRSVALALSAWSRQSELARRVHSLLRPARPMSRVQARCAMVLVCLGLGAGALEMARAPRLFSFTDVPSFANASSFTNTAATNAISAPTGEIVAAKYTAGAAKMQALPAVYHPAVPPRATTLKTGSPHKVRRVSGPGASGAGVVLRTARVAKTRQQPRVVLTTLEMQNREFGAGAGRVQPIEYSPSYAAVPFGDGWLILQL